MHDSKVGYESVINDMKQRHLKTMSVLQADKDELLRNSIKYVFISIVATHNSLRLEAEHRKVKGELEAERANSFDMRDMNTRRLSSGCDDISSGYSSTNGKGYSNKMLDYTSHLGSPLMSPTSPTCNNNNFSVGILAAYRQRRVNSTTDMPLMDNTGSLTRQSSKTKYTELCKKYMCVCER